MTITFQNPGEIDIRGATIAGLSAKVGDSPIGKFGTGLKYAIASILRWGGEVTIYSGTDCYIFESEAIDFRGSEHHQVVMSRNDGPANPIGITTHYGHHWAAWQVFRELYSNARDEQGDVVDGHLLHGTGHTTITITCPQVEAEFNNRHLILLPTSKRYLETRHDCMVAEGKAAWLYYRGVRVRHQDCIFTWNVTSSHIQLTEDRVLADTYYYEQVCEDLVRSSNDEEFIERILRAPENSFESGLNWVSYEDYSEEFVAVAARLYKQQPQKFQKLKGLLDQKRPDLTAPQLVPLTAIQQKMLNRAIMLVDRMGLSETVDVNNLQVVELGKDTLGLSKGNLIQLSPLVFKQGTKQLVSTLYEEQLHKTTGMRDNTYEMQTWLFNRIVDLFEEHVFGEAC